MEFTIESGVLTKYSGPGGAVVIPEGVFAIGERAFYNCLDLNGITFPEGLVKIGAEAFYNCQGLTELNFPERLQEIGEQAFLRLLAADQSGGSGGVKLLPREVFAECQYLTSVRFSEGLEELERRAFGHCWQLEQVRLPDSVTRLHRLAFGGCDALTDLRADGIPLNDLSVQNRLAAMVDFARRLRAGEKFSPERLAESLQFIRSSRKKLYPYAIQYEDLLRLMLEEQMIPRKDLQLLLDEADQQNNAAARTAILEYQP